MELLFLHVWLLLVCILGMSVLWAQHKLRQRRRKLQQLKRHLLQLARQRDERMQQLLR